MSTIRRGKTTQEGWEETRSVQNEQQTQSLARSLHDIIEGTYFSCRHTAKNLFVYPVLKALGIYEKHIGFVPMAPDATPELKVIGVGYGRTGTYSLSLALTQLGIPTLHTMAMYESKPILDMWASSIFEPSIAAEKAMLGTPNIDLVAEQGFQATTDLPMALYFEQIHERFPDCKFILTMRDDSEVWFQSWNVLAQSIVSPTRAGSTVVTNVAKYMNYLRWLFAVINKDDAFLTAPFPLPDQDKDRAIASYEEHNRRVRETIPSDLLLEYNVKEGWEPLCDFLEIAHCPTDTPFPRTNSATSIKAQSVIAFILPLTLVLFVIFSGCALTFQRVTNKTVLGWMQYQLMTWLTPRKRTTGSSGTKNNSSSNSNGKKSSRRTLSPHKPVKSA